MIPGNVSVVLLPFSCTGVHLQGSGVHLQWYVVGTCDFVLFSASLAALISPYYLGGLLMLISGSLDP